LLLNAMVNTLPAAHAAATDKLSFLLSVKLRVVLTGFGLGADCANAGTTPRTAKTSTTRTNFFILFSLE
jgi:hypothetical protein